MFMRIVRRCFWTKTAPVSRRRTPAGLRLESLEGRVVPSTVTVGPGQSLQAAITAAAPGSVLEVSGVHAEQLSITKPLTLVGKPTRGTPAEIEAPTGLTGGPIVDVAAPNVTIRGLTISGQGNAAGLIDSAIDVESGASAVIQNDTITGLYNGTISQVGYGIRVNSLAVANIIGNTISDYQKGGVIVDGAGASAVITGNTITGVGTNGNVAQNGVQISDGASALVTGNTISANSYSGAVNGTGVYVYNDPAGTATVLVSQNYLSSNDVGALIQSSSGVGFAGNRVTSSNVDGLYLDGSTGVSITTNQINNNGGNGVVLFDSTGNSFLGNTVAFNAGNGLAVNGGGGNLITLSAFVGNGAAGVELYQTTGNVVSLDLFVLNAGGGVTQQGGSTGNTLLGNTSLLNNLGSFGFPPGLPFPGGLGGLFGPFWACC
jgi:nitrous oxidase accessory protein